MAVLPPLSLYIHVPWCVRKCPYCDFNSHQASAELPEQAYVDALLADLSADLHQVQGRRISTLFIGGGTPSLLSVDAYARLFRGLHERLDIDPQAEITLEANPGTAEAEKFAGYRALGINRLSIGIQSFQPQHLQALGRIHDAGQALRAIALAQAAGFSNFNVDLMYGLPGQTQQQALDDLQQALAYQPPHLSWYQLTIEPNTEFYKYPPRLPEDDDLWDIQDAGLQLLQEQGYEHYEISAHARPGMAARHNLNYWQFGDYLGIGAGAHGKITTPDGQVIRTHKTRLPKDYLQPEKAFLAGQTRIEPVDIGLECLMNALRLRDGIRVSDFEQRTGLTLQDVAVPVQKARQLGLLAVNERLAATEKGQQYLNELLALFLPDD